MFEGQINQIISIIIDNNNNNNDNNNNNNNNNNHIPLNDFQQQFLKGGGGKCSHQLRPFGHKIFVEKYNSFYADDLQTMR